MSHAAQPLLLLVLGALVAAWSARAPAQSAGAPPPLPPESAFPPSSVTRPVGTQPPPACDRCGTIEAIRQATTREQWTPLGSVPSRLDSTSNISPSAVTTFKIGPGLSNQGQVMIGAAGGAVYQTRPAERNATRWEVVVRMDDGTTRSVTQNYEPLLQVGDRVRVFGTQLELVPPQ